MIRFRSSLPEVTADRLTKLCILSKSHWGYDAEFMRQSASALTVTAAMIEQGRVRVAEDQRGSLMGVASLEATKTEGRFDLSLLFVEPSVIRTGVGRTLFEAAVELVVQDGGTSLLILSDPFAAAFYQRLGAVKIGEAPSDAIPGRYLPLLEYAISERLTAG